jgi:hypothetical protein
MTGGGWRRTFPTKGAERRGWRRLEAYVSHQRRGKAWVAEAGGVRFPPKARKGVAEAGGVRFPPKARKGVGGGGWRRTFPTKGAERRGWRRLEAYVPHQRRGNARRSCRDTALVGTRLLAIHSATGLPVLADS